MTNSEKKVNPSKQDISTNTDVLPDCPYSGQEKERIYVENLQQTENPEKQSHYNEMAERQMQLSEQNNKLKDEIKELQKAKSAWEKHCHLLDKKHSEQQTIFSQELNDCKKQIKHLEIRVESKEHELEECQRKAEQKIQDSSDQRAKAISFASAQAEKVDELKRTVRKEQTNSKELNEKIRLLQADIATQKDEIEALNRANAERVTSLNTPDISLNQTQDTQNVLNLSTENKAPQSTSHQENRQTPVSFRLGNETGTAGDKSIMLRETRAEKEVLKHQVTIYREDFDKERRDRERAQAEISSLKSASSQMHEDIQMLQNELRKRKKDIESLRAAREQDKYQLQMKQEEIHRLHESVQAKVAENRHLQTEVEALRRQQYGAAIPNQPSPPPYQYVQKPPYQGPDAYNPVRQQESEFLPKEWKRQIQKNFDKFCSCLRPSDVIVQLYRKNIISVRQKEELDVMGIESKKAEYIINDIILRGTKETLSVFKQSLLDTNQNKLAKLLPDESFAPDGIWNQGWNCSFCTYENPGDVVRCEMCDNLSASHSGQFMYQQDRIGRDIDRCDGSGGFAQSLNDGHLEYDFQIDG